MLAKTTLLFSKAREEENKLQVICSDYIICSLDGALYSAAPVGRLKRNRSTSPLLYSNGVQSELSLQPDDSSNPEMDAAIGHFRL